MVRKRRNVFKVLNLLVEIKGRIVQFLILKVIILISAHNIHILTLQFYRGERVMGMSNYGSLATFSLTSKYLTLPVPSEWTLEDAATVPLVYATVLYAFSVSILDIMIQLVTNKPRRFVLR